MTTTTDKSTEEGEFAALSGYANENTRRTENGAGGGGTRYAPIFERGGVRFIFLYADTSPSSEEEAWKIGWGMALVECILLGCKYHGEVLAWNPADDPQCQQGELGGKRIAVVGGWGEVLRAHGGSSHNDQAERHSEPNPR
jgi:hypothetical protein